MQGQNTDCMGCYDDKEDDEVITLIYLSSSTKEEDN